MKHTYSPVRIVPLFLILLLVLVGCADTPALSTKTTKTSQAKTGSTTQSDQYSITTDTTPSTPSTTPSSMIAATQAAAPEKGQQIAILTTSKGVIKMKFFPMQAPETVKNFVELSKKKFYDGLTFHRVIPGFMIQGGDPKGNGTGGETYKGPGTTLKGEVSKDLHHIHGAVAMANRANPDTATSQFYIVQKKEGTAFLDGGYTIFGQVYEGLDVVDAIAAVERNDEDRPLTPIKITKVEITTAE